MSKAFWLLLALLCSATGRAESQFSIGGLVVDQTISRIGHLFYEELVNGWEVPGNEATIVVHERPDMFAGNMIWIEVNDNVVFEERIGTRPSGIEETAQTAKSKLDLYLMLNREALHELDHF